MPSIINLSKLYSFTQILDYPSITILLTIIDESYDTSSSPKNRAQINRFCLKVQRNLWPRVSLDRPDKIITREPALLFVEERRDRCRKILEMVSRQNLRRPARNQRNEASRSLSFEKGTNDFLFSSSME